MCAKSGNPDEMTMYGQAKMLKEFQSDLQRELNSEWIFFKIQISS